MSKYDLQYISKFPTYQFDITHKTMNKKPIKSSVIQPLSHNGHSKSNNIIKYFEQWQLMVENVDKMIKETLDNTLPNAHNKKVLDSLKRRHHLFENVRTKFDSDVKKQLIALGPDAGEAVLAWAQAEFLRKLNQAIKVHLSLGSICTNMDTIQTKMHVKQSKADSANKMSDGNGSNISSNRAASLKDIQYRWEQRQEILRQKREEFRRQRLLHTHPMPTQLSASERARISRRIPALRMREQNIINSQRSIGTIRKLIGNVGANREKVAELSRSMLRKGSFIIFINQIIHVIIMFTLRCPTFSQVPYDD